MLENFTTYAFCPSTHPCGERLTYQTTVQILHKFEGDIEHNNTAQKKKFGTRQHFFVVLRYSPYLRRPRVFSIWTVLKVNNPLSPPTFSDPLPVSLFVSETGGNTDLKQLKSSLIRHASYYIKHVHNFNRSTFSSFQRPIVCCQAEEGHGGENYCKKNKLRCQVDDEEKGLSNSGNSNFFWKYVPQNRSRHHK